MSRAQVILAALIVLSFASQRAEAIPGRYAECAGEIYAAKTREKISFEQLSRALNPADVILFGERHETPSHAASAACVVNALADDGRPLSIVMEMIPRRSDDLVQQYTRENAENAAGLGVALKWWESGWPAFSNWLPLIEAAFLSRSPILGGDLPPNATPQTVLPASELATLKSQLGDAFTSVQSNWSEAMLAANCGMIDKKQATALGQYQMRRDLSIADAVRDRINDGSATLAYVGRSHARNDRSLHQLLGSNSELKLHTVGAFSHDETLSDSDWTAFDYIWVVGENRTKTICSLLNGGVQTQ